MVADAAGAVHKQMMSLPTRHLPTLTAVVALVVVPLPLVVLLLVVLELLPPAGAVGVAEVVDEEDVADVGAMLRLRNLRIRFRI